MAEDLLTPNSLSGKTFTIAMWALGAVAVAQILAVGLAVVTQADAYPARQSQIADSHSVAREGATQRSAVSPPGHAATPSVAESQPGVPVEQTRPEAAAGASPMRPPTNPPRESSPVENYDPFADAPLPPRDTPGTGQAPGAADSAAQAAMRSALPPLPDLKHGGLASAAAASLTAAAPAPPPEYRTAPIPPLPSGQLNDLLLPAPQFGDPEGKEPLAAALSSATLTPHRSHHIDNPILRELVASGAELRGSGNMQGSLHSLRQAEAALPDHPRILSEIAATYSEMGLTRKAVLYWEKVRALGAEKGGAYFDLADMELKGQRLRTAAARTVLRIGAVEATRDPSPLAGERVVLRVTIEAEPGARPSPGDMAMLVYFYDLVNGEKWEASTADTSQNFVSAPYDWQDGGREIIEVIYRQPVFSETQKRELGERAYYGYVIELYYRDELQGTAAEPADLKLIEDPVPEGNPGLFGPENALFPDSSPLE